MIFSSTVNHLCKNIKMNGSTQETIDDIEIKEEPVGLESDGNMEDLELSTNNNIADDIKSEIEIGNETSFVDSHTITECIDIKDEVLPNKIDIEEIEKNPLLSDPVVISEVNRNHDSSFEAGDNTDEKWVISTTPAIRQLAMDYRSDSETDSNESTDSVSSVDSESSSSCSSLTSTSEDSSDSDDKINLRQFKKQKDNKRKMTMDGLLDDKLPPIEDLHISVSQSECVMIGTIFSIVPPLVTVEAYKNSPPLNIDTVLFLDMGERTLGRIYDVIGPVTEPMYCIRFNSEDDIKTKSLFKGLAIYYAPKTHHTHFVFVSELLKMKGSDASWKDNQEIPVEHQDFSDDEEENRVLARQKCLNRRSSYDGDAPLPKKASATDVRPGHSFQPRGFRPVYQFSHQSPVTHHSSRADVQRFVTPPPSTFNDTHQQVQTSPAPSLASPSVPSLAPRVPVHMTPPRFFSTQARFCTPPPPIHPVALGGPTNPILIPSNRPPPLPGTPQNPQHLIQTTQGATTPQYHFPPPPFRPVFNNVRPPPPPTNPTHSVAPRAVVENIPSPGNNSPSTHFAQCSIQPHLVSVSCFPNPQVPPIPPPSVILQPQFPNPLQRPPPGLNGPPHGVVSPHPNQRPINPSAWIPAVRPVQRGYNQNYPRLRGSSFHMNNVRGVMTGPPLVQTWTSRRKQPGEHNGNNFNRN